MRKKLIAGNWKMNQTKADGLALAKAVFEVASKEKGNFDVLICPGMNLLPLIAELPHEGVYLGAQDVSVAPKDFGAYTGDVSAAQLKDLGASHVIVGHSERRAMRHETDAIVKEKALNAIEKGLIPVVCVGETLEEREEGKALEIVCRQIRESVPSIATGENLVVAYEPVWAIGTGKVPSVQDVEEMHTAIREEIKSLLGESVASTMRILYGGSVKPSNAKELLGVANVDGALIGGASLKVEDFWGIAATQM
ncbi:MAG: triose-phosphate isomerase [Alphaproteobacteria bacterium]|nr:triose-phosphate isomerase [Alphaproteobacteria bacterium]